MFRKKVGATWAFIPSLASVLFTLIRTALEDNALHAELDGYRQYAQQTPYRLFPGIW